MAKKHDPITSVPKVLTAPWIKRFFKEFFGTPVRVQSANSGSFVCVWIPCNPGGWKFLTWDHHFPEELGNRCMRIVYADSEKLREQNWGGNINAHSISMIGSQFRRLLSGLIAERNKVCCD